MAAPIILAPDGPARREHTPPAYRARRRRQRMNRRLGGLIIAVIAVTTLLGGSIIGSAGDASAQTPPAPTPTPVTTGNIPVVAINPAICLPLIGTNSKAIAQDALACSNPVGPGNTSVFDRV